MANKQARVLVAFPDGGVVINPNQLVEGVGDKVDSLEAAGIVDSDDNAVAYCKTQKEKVVKINGDGVDFSQVNAKKAAAAKQKEAAHAKKVKTAQAKLDKANENLTKAPEDKKPAAQKAVDVAQKALDALI